MDSQQSQISYYQERMDLLGVTDELNTVMLWHGTSGENELRPVPIFRETPKGIEILVYTLDRHKIPYAKEGSRHRTQEYAVTRLQEPKVKKDGSVQKYDMPKGQPTKPFFPPALLEAYEKKQRIPVLYITEGYFKAFKACMHGIMCVGLPSITCMRDSSTGKLYEDIRRLLIDCKVDKVVWLTDGDCRNITSKELTDGIDLYKRPFTFFQTVAKFRDLLSDFADMDKFFAHIDSDNLQGEPKGLDDLLCTFPDDIDGIKKDFESFDKIKEGAVYTGKYLVKIKVTWGVNKVQQYFHLNSVDNFYLFHVERRKDLEKIKFVFNGTQYKYNSEKGTCEIIVPGDASRYFRVGDLYYEHIEIPNKHGERVRTYHRRDKKTIQDDCGKEIFKHIPKYKAFCNVPDHENYQRVIDNCFNLYHPFTHEPEAGDFTNTLTFIKHIFGEEEISYHDAKNGVDVNVKRWELGLDYISLLYSKPQHILPILCLVSKENETGKTTFVNWLKKIFEENVAIVGNADFQSDFNAHWTNKLIIACDETKIDKHSVVEKIKAMSTASEVMINAKGRDQVSMEFFGKFILLSNNEDNFITITDQDIRFWVIKVPVIQNKNQDLMELLIEELPAFLHFISTRKLATERRQRHWFDNRLLHTDALEKLRSNSKPSIQKHLRIALEELFAASEMNEITMPLTVIANELLRRPMDKDYIRRTLQDMGYRVGEPGRGHYPRFKEVEEPDPSMTLGSPMKNITVMKCVPVQFHGRYYTFKRSDFLGDSPMPSLALQEDLSLSDGQNIDDLPF